MNCRRTRTLPQGKIILLYCWFRVIMVTGAFSPLLFCPSPRSSRAAAAAAIRGQPLLVSVGLGPEDDDDDETSGSMVATNKEEEEPNHELYRTSRMSKFDYKCDAWFASLLGTDHPETPAYLQEVSRAARQQLMTLPELKREIPKEFGEEGFTPYVRTLLPTSPIVPAYGCEQFGIPIVRRNAEAWRQFDVFGMVQVDYSQTPSRMGQTVECSAAQTAAYQSRLQDLGVWLDDADCLARLVYVNGCYCPSLSKPTKEVCNVGSADLAHKLSESLQEKLQRLPDGFTDRLAVDVPVGSNVYWNSYSQLSGPDHNVGNPTSQFAINSQQGTACFAALNSVRAGCVALVDIPPVTHDDADTTTTTMGRGPDEGSNDDKKEEEEEEDVLPVLIIDAMTSDGGLAWTAAEKDSKPMAGVAYHPRVLCVAGEGSRVGLVQSSVDLDDWSSSQKECRPIFRNGYTQVFVEKNAVVRHSQMNESGGFVTPSVEDSSRLDDDDEVDEDERSKQRILANTRKEAGTPDEEDAAEQASEREEEEVPSSLVPPAATALSDLSPRQVEASRPALQNTYFETVDAHVVGEGGRYQVTSLEMGGHGRARTASSVSLLQPGAQAKVRGLSLAGGLQVSDMRTNLHHVAQGTSSNQVQKNLVGGRARSIFRGRVRVEQSAQQTDSEQLSRTILLSDKAHIWTIPSLEIIADDVSCAHGATVADLSEEEMFYLRARGISREMARNMLMFGFVSDISKQVNSYCQGDVEDETTALQARLLKRLQAIVPTGDRAVMGAFQSV